MRNIERHYTDADLPVVRGRRMRAAEDDQDEIDFLVGVIGFDRARSVWIVGGSAKELPERRQALMDKIRVVMNEIDVTLCGKSENEDTFRTSLSVANRLMDLLSLID